MHASGLHHSLWSPTVLSLASSKSHCASSCANCAMKRQRALPSLSYPVTVNFGLKDLSHPANSSMHFHRYHPIKSNGWGWCGLKHVSADGQAANRIRTAISGLPCTECTKSANSNAKRWCKNHHVEPKIHGFMNGKNPSTAEIPATRMVPFFCFNVFIGYADLVSGVIRRSLVLLEFGS